MSPQYPQNSSVLQNVVMPEQRAAIPGIPAPMADYHAHDLYFHPAAPFGRATLAQSAPNPYSSMANYMPMTYFDTNMAYVDESCGPSALSSNPNLEERLRGTFPQDPRSSTKTSLSTSSTLNESNISYPQPIPMPPTGDQNPYGFFPSQPPMASSLPPHDHLDPSSLPSNGSDASDRFHGKLNGSAFRRAAIFRYAPYHVPFVSPEEAAKKQS
jgi:hypothetical protein